MRKTITLDFKIKNAKLSLRPILKHWFYLFVLFLNLFDMYKTVQRNVPVYFILNYTGAYVAILCIGFNYKNYSENRIARLIDKFFYKSAIIRNY